MGEWIRFWLVAFFLIVGLFCLICEVIGVYRFGFVMNRIHAAGIGDSMGLFCIIFSMMIASGPGMDTLKFLLIIVFMWCSSPASTHFFSQVEYYTNPRLYLYAERLEDLPGGSVTEKNGAKAAEAAAKDAEAAAKSAEAAANVAEAAARAADAAAKETL